MSQLSQYSKARIAITTAFIINGSIAGTFYSRIADIKEELDLSNSALGFALLVVSIGVLVGLGFSGKQSAKRGSVLENNQLSVEAHPLPSMQHMHWVRRY